LIEVASGSEPNWLTTARPKIAIETHLLLDAVAIRTATIWLVGAVDARRADTG
jgi:hypothetical protein